MSNFTVAELLVMRRQMMENGLKATRHSIAIYYDLTIKQADHIATLWDRVEAIVAEGEAKP